MERLAADLPHPSVPSIGDQGTVKDASYLNMKAIKQAKSLIRSREARESERGQGPSYRKRYGGSLLLSVQYRMHPSIAAFPSAIFYDGQLATPDFMACNRQFPRVLVPKMPCEDSNLCVRLVDVGGKGNERQGMPSRFTRTVFGSTQKASSLEDQTTYWNELEAEKVVSIVRDVAEDNSREVKNIGIVTPYSGQVQLIKSMIAGDSELREALGRNPVSIEVKSVDGYQGRERDLIIFSAVRSNRQGRIGFLQDWRRMNVALTRAKSGLVVVGDFETLAEADMHWDAFFKWASGF
jgi:regulator of nonsense transcripts 1